MRMMGTLGLQIAPFTRAPPDRLGPGGTFDPKEVIMSMWMSGWRRRQQGTDSDVAGAPRRHRAIRTSDLLAGSVVAIAVAGCMVAAAPAVSALASNESDVAQGAQTHQADRSGDAERQAQADGGVRTTSVGERWADGQSAALLSAQDLDTAPGTADLLQRAAGQTRTEFKQGTPITLDSAAWAAATDAVSFDWDGTVKLTFNSLTAYDSLEAAGIPHDRLRFDANDASWQESKPKELSSRYVPVVADVTYENVDATPKSDCNEFFIGTIGLYNESSPVSWYARDTYFYAWSDAAHDLACTDRNGASYTVENSLTFALEPGQTREVKIAFWVPESDLKAVRAGNGAFFARVGSVEAADGGTVTSKAISIPMTLA